MAFTLFNFTKSWRNAGDFPTFEPSEEKVRDDMQSLFDELKTGLNRLIGELKAENLPFTPTAEVDSSDVQNAIENVQSQIAAAIIGQIPDKSVTSEKIADGGVETENIADGAVTSVKLEDEAVTSSKIADDAVGTDSIADGAVTGDKIADGTIGLSKLSAAAQNAKADLVNGKVRASQASRARVNVTASRNLTLDDDGKALYVYSSSPVTVTLPLNSAVQLPIGSEITVYRMGTGSVSLAAAEGVTLYCADALNALEQYDSAKLKKWEANVWSAEMNHRAADGEISSAKLADGAVTAAKIASGAVTGAKIASGAVSTVYTASVPLHGIWHIDGDYCYNSVTVPGILAADDPIIDVVWPASAEDIERTLEQWSCFLGATTEEGTVNFYVKEVPPHVTPESLPVKILCIRK